MKRIHRILIVIIIALVVVTGSGIYYNRYLNSMNSFFEEDSVKDTVKNSIIQITVGNHTGTGIVFDETAEKFILVTNAHLLTESLYEDDNNIKVTLMSGNDYKITILGISNEFDIGFCELEKALLIKEGSDTIKKAELVSAFELQENVVHVGINTKKLSAKEDDIILYEGQLIDYKFIPEFYEMMLVSKGYSQPGMSGGGIFNSNNQLIGILSGGEVINDENITYAIPVEDVYKAFDEINN